jgi:NMT1-like family
LVNEHRSGRLRRRSTAGGSAAAQDGAKAIQKTTIQKTTIVLGTATPGGGFPLYGNTFAEVMNEADPGLPIEPRNTKGSNENIPLLEAGQLDIALVAGEPAYQAFMGIERARTNLKILTAMYSTWCARTARTRPFAISLASRSRSARVRRRAGDGARWTGRSALGRRHRLARICRHSGKPRRRQVHRTGCR